MDVAVAALHRAGDGTEVRAGDLDGLLAEGEAAGLVADESCENIPLVQAVAEGRRDRLLPAAGVDAARDPARPVDRGEFLLQAAGQEHRAENGGESFGWLAHVGSGGARLSRKRRAASRTSAAVSW